jgi:hypothetical protein
MNRVTASGSGRLLQCSGHARLAWVRETSNAATEGTRLHAIMETLDGQTRSAQVDAEPLCDVAWGELEHKILSTTGEVAEVRTERAYVLDTETRTGRIVQLTGPREYGALRWHEIAGTADAVLRVVPHEPGRDLHVIVDWKFGMEPVAADTAQLRTLAAAHMLAMDDQMTLEGVLVAIVQSNDAGCTVRTHWWTRDDLMAHVELLGEALNEVHEGSITLQRGPECRYCPAANSCPAQLASLSALVAPGGAGPITPARAGEIWAELRQAKKRLEQIEDACKQLAAEGDGLPLPGGKRLTVVQRSRTSMDAKALEAIARGHGASDEEIIACSKTTTYTTTQEIKA